MAWRPPKRLLILGKWVEVRVVSAEVIRDVVGDHDGADGAWDHDTMTIYLPRAATPAQRERAYWHELLHCLVDRFLDP